MGGTVCAVVVLPALTVTTAGAGPQVTQLVERFDSHNSNLRPDPSGEGLGDLQCDAAPRYRVHASGL